MLNFNATIHNANIRGCEKKENKKGEAYLLVRLEDENGKPLEMVDKNINHENDYIRDLTCDLIINVDQGVKFTTIRIVDFKKV